MWLLSCVETGENMVILISGAFLIRFLYFFFAKRNLIRLRNTPENFREATIPGCWAVLKLGKIWSYWYLVRILSDFSNFCCSPYREEENLNRATSSACSTCEILWLLSATSKVLSPRSSVRSAKYMFQKIGEAVSPVKIPITDLRGGHFVLGHGHQHSDHSVRGTPIETRLRPSFYVSGVPPTSIYRHFYTPSHEHWM